MGGAQREGRCIDGPVVGLGYQGAHHQGRTDLRGAFTYDEGDVVTFSIGGLLLGSTRGRERVTPVDLAGAERAPDPLDVPGVVNRARLLHALAATHDVGDGIEITAEVEAAVDAVRSDLDFDVPVEQFATDPALLELLARLRRRLPSVAEVRNQLRRTLAGIRKRSDVPVPLRDGHHLLADVFEPLDGGAHPVVLRCGVYGRAFDQGSVCDRASREASEVREDRWFTHPRDQLSHLSRYSENVVSANTVDWVPRGYVCVRVDARGVGPTPGVIDPFSAQEADDYHDVIEWAATAPFCDGNVGLLGASYHATTQWAVAATAPPSLKAMIPFAGDGDAYRELSYHGGILIEGVRRGWVEGLVRPNQCPGARIVDLVGNLVEHPYDDPSDYGPGGKVLVGADHASCTTPFLTAVSMSSTIHGRAGIEAFVQSPAEDKRLFVVDGSYLRFLYEDTLEAQVAFFERHLRGRTDLPDEAPVRIVVRTGDGGWTWRDEQTWPPAGTTYRSLHLDAAASGPDDGRWGAGGGLGWEPPTDDAERTWSADVLADADPLGPGVAFTTAPLPEELELVGHLTARLWVSASAADADLFVALRVLGPDGAEVPYAVGDSDPAAPLSFGALKVSQRATDPARSTPERPWHTHALADRAPLTSPEEVVEVEVELLPFTARVPAGHRLRLELQPLDGRVGTVGRMADSDGVVAGRRYDRSYHDGAWNRVHTGPSHPSVLVLPVVPRTR